MADELAKQTSSLLEKLQGTNPFATLPAEWVGPAGYFAMCKTSLLKSNGSFWPQLKYWIKLGLEVEDGERIFQRLCHPAVAREHNYPNQLEVAMNALVDEAIRARKSARERTLRREADASAAAALICTVADSFKGTQ